MTATRARTVGELRASGYRVLPVKEELRKNLIAKMRAGETLFPGIVGYDETVLPQIENAILAGQDIIFLGERGQAKTRIIRAFVNLLDEYIPMVAGSEINDDPYKPISQHARELLEREGDNTPIEWVHRDQRYGEKLATPDVTIADLIGEVDPIRVAEGRYLSDELTIHYGLVPRTNRGVFAINELPDLAERIQVGLFNIMEERDVQIRGYRIRLPLDVYVIASANPEDYTNRGRIITPLKDRYGAEIRTHYPKTLDHEISIMDSETTRYTDSGLTIEVPRYMKEIVAEITHLARHSPDINQRSGVSVRVSIANNETMVSNAIRRAIRRGEDEVAPRVSDLPYLIASMAGKIELESVEEGREEQTIQKILQKAVLNVFSRHFEPGQFQDLIEAFKGGLSIEVSDAMSAKQYVQIARETGGGLMKAVRKLEAEKSPALTASAVEFVLEGLHLNKKLNKDRLTGKALYRG